jgi:ATP-dependent Clp protease ATP-binding subunit ClpX
MLEIDTSKILFIAGGAFVGLPPIIKNRLNGATIGFTSPVATAQDVDLGQVTPDDLVKFGMIPEFVGRFPSVVTLEELDAKDMRNILTEVKNNLIEQYQWLFECDSVKLSFTDSGLDAIVAKAMESGTGARALHSQLEQALIPHMFEVIGYKNNGITTLEIDAEQVNNPIVVNVH